MILLNQTYMVGISTILKKKAFQMMTNVNKSESLKKNRENPNILINISTHIMKKTGKTPIF